ncbi:MAG: Asp-tRNA(Asn)/Glu-tRNA(Gln) amidotransferase subunit GatA [Cytophagales bacterium]|nr:Asp-tRNA(Asn)/Glu-tRNA(Gln) amidotransferase subunit GatA [Cytophagales bacterium]
MKVHPSFGALHAVTSKGRDHCLEEVRHCLANIAKNKHLNAFLTIYEEEALQRARTIDQKIREGKGGKLAGLVVGLKDLLCYQDHPVQASSKMLEGFISQFSATVVQRLIDEDAIIMGHQNCDQFGMGSSNENTAFGPVLNPIDPTKVPGGSSGGSAVGVQAGMCHVALGSDTGGSVRQPAAFCGIVGLKPTYARISRHGLIAYASSFDTIGILSKNVEDCATVLEVIAGKDDFDSTVAKKTVPPYTKQLTLNKKVKVAYLKETLEHQGLQEEIRSNTLATIRFLKSEGHQVGEVDFSLLEYVLPTYQLLSTAEASANLARFDGVRYGYRSPHATTLTSIYNKTRTEGFGKEVQRRILLGTFALSANYCDAYYVKAQKVRRLIKEKTEAILAEYDFIILPTTPTTAFRLGGYTQDPLTMYLADTYTVQASVAGVPAISIPNGVDKEGLPIGLQIIANAFEEQSLLAFAQYLSKVREEK